MTLSLRFKLLFLCMGPCLGLSIGCQVKSEGLRTEVLGPTLPDSQCAYSTAGALYSAGFYDPTVDGGQGYSLALVLRNNTMAAADDAVAAGELTNVNRRARDVQVTSFDGCWYMSTDGATYGGDDASRQVDCDSLPNQRGRLPAFGALDEGGGMGVVQLRVLDVAALRDLFGEGYSPAQIPATGAYVYQDPSVNPQVANGSQTSAVRKAYAFAPQDPATPGRSAFWGANHPARKDVTVTVQLRANMVTQSGDTLVGNWFRVPITVCTGCLQDYCGPLVEQVCARGPCSDGSECLSTGLCANTALTCSPVALYSGARPDFFGSEAAAPCLPAQAFASTTPLACTPVGCQATN